MTDVIEMTRFGTLPPTGSPLATSPDGRYVAAVMYRGDLARNVNRYTLLLIRAAGLSRPAVPDTLVQLASSSSRPAIAQVRWLADARTLAFLGEYPHGTPQVYTVDVHTRQVVQRTHISSTITSFAMAPGGDPMILATVPPPLDTSRRAADRAHGFAVSPTAFVGDLIAGRWEGLPVDDYRSRFVVVRGGTAPITVRGPGPAYTLCYDDTMTVAPDGGSAVLQCLPTTMPASWRRYKWHWHQKALAENAALSQLMLIDLRRGTMRPLLDAPAGIIFPTVAWAPDGQSVVVANVSLPLDTADSAELAARLAAPGVAEIDVHTGHVTVIVHRDSLEVLGWDPGTNTIDLVPGLWDTGRQDGPHVYFRKGSGGWSDVAAGTRAWSAHIARTRVVIDEGMNTPPRLVAVDAVTHQRRIIFDPNPQFVDVRWAIEHVVTWRTPRGATWRAGLYLPRDYQPGRRYPLVIQTHRFDSTQFWPDGPYTTASGAQPLAAHGIAVLQLGLAGNASDSGAAEFGTAREAPGAMEGIEAAIDHLDSLGLIDRTKVGLVGFSRSCYHVQYALAHSRDAIAAASLSDGVDYSYMQYMLWTGLFRSWGTGDGYQPMYGVPPFGSGLDRWRTSAPDFHMDHWTAPLRIEAIGRYDPLFEWEAYAGMLLQGKPVEMIYLPDAAHIVVRPWERLTSQGGTVDWFDFWLNGHEDPDASKVEQYVRWHALRARRDSLAGQGRSAAAIRSANSSSCLPTPIPTYGTDGSLTPRRLGLFSNGATITNPYYKGCIASARTP